MYRLLLILFLVLPGMVFASDNQQNLQAKVTQLEQQTTALQTSLKQANARLDQDKNILLNNKILLKSQVKQTFFQKLIQGFDLQIGIGFLILAALLLVWLFWPTRMQKIANKQSGRLEPSLAALEDDEGEYDYMGSDEAIGTKLDLARAYIDMGENETAKGILEDVLKKGDQPQQAEAFGLLGKL